MKFFYLGDQLAAVRKEAFKVHFLESVSGPKKFIERDTPLLFNLHEDPAEQFNIAPNYPKMLQILADLRICGFAGSASGVGCEGGESVTPSIIAPLF